jgi:uncharacterized repeat protein (TIGR02543 family)
MMNRKRIYAGAVLLLFFSACDLMGPEFKMEPVPDVILDGTDAVSDGRVALRIGIEGAGMQARTVKPGVTLGAVTIWKLLGKKTSDTGPETPLEDFSDPATTVVYLETGTWDFTLEGYTDTGFTNLILRGIITGKSISVPDTLSFEVAPVSEDTGTFKMTINLPTGHGITRAEVFKDGTKFGGDLAPSGDGNTIAYENLSHAAGDYYFSFRLYKGTDLYGVVSELVQVRKNLTSEKIIPLTKEDLNIAYEITYNLDGGAFAVVVPGYYRSTDADYTLPVPTKTGYNFGGWYKDNVFTDPAVTKITQGSIEDKNFYAKWEVITYDITYGLNGGINDTRNPANYTIESAAITLHPATRTGYAFDGWYDSSGFAGTEVTSIPAGSTEDKTFYAKWLSTNASLSGISIGGTPLTLTAGTYTYNLYKATTSVPTGITLKVTAGEAGQVIAANLNGVASSEVTLTSGANATFATGLGLTNTLVITVTAPDGLTQNIYTVNISGKEIIEFYFTDGGKKYGVKSDAENSSGTINQTTHVMEVTVPYGTVLTNLTPTVVHSGASISPVAGTAWGSGAGSHTYTVTAEDGTDQAYEVTVNVAPGITIIGNGITIQGLPMLTFTSDKLTPLSTVTVAPSITITISGSVTVSSWYIGISGREDITYTTNTFTTPATRGFYNVNVFATVDGIPYSGSFGMVVD